VDHRLCDLADHLPRRASNESGSENLVRSFRALDFIDAPFRFTNSSITPVEVFGVNIIFDPFFFESHFIQTHGSYFWVCICASRQYNIRFTFLALEQCIPYSVSGMHVGIMRELRAWEAVADGVNVWVGCLQELIDVDAVIVKLNVGVLTLQVLNVRDSPCGDHYHIHLMNYLFLCGFVFHKNFNFVGVCLFNFLDTCLEDDAHSIFDHLVLEISATVRVFTR